MARFGDYYVMTTLGPHKKTNKKRAKHAQDFFLKERMRGNAQKRQDVEKKSGEEVDENKRYVGRMGEGRTNGCTIDLIQ
jgi:hypothetical protein